MTMDDDGWRWMTMDDDDDDDDDGWWMMMDDDGWWWMMMDDDGWWWMMMDDDGWWWWWWWWCDWCDWTIEHNGSFLSRSTTIHTLFLQSMIWLYSFLFFIHICNLLWLGVIFLFINSWICITWYRMRLEFSQRSWGIRRMPGFGSVGYGLHLDKMGP